MIKLIKKNLPVMLMLALFVVIPMFVAAQDGGSNPPPPDGSSNPPPARITNPLSGSIDTIPKFLTALLEGAIKIGIPIVALAVIYSGFLFVKAQGNPEEINKAKEALLYTLIGAAVLLGALAIAELVKDTIIGIGS